jgi:hypothetical protein
MRRRLSICLFVLLAAAPAAALGNLTGTYEGLLACELVPGSGKLDFRLETGFDVADNGAGVLAFRLLNNGLLFRGAVDSEHPDRGRLGALLCSFNGVTGGNLFHGLATAKEGSDKASLNLQFIDMFIGSQSVGYCTFKGKRVSTKLPAPVACP